MKNYFFKEEDGWIEIESTGIPNWTTVRADVNAQYYYCCVVCQIAIGKQREDKPCLPGTPGNPLIPFRKGINFPSGPLSPCTPAFIK